MTYNFDPERWYDTQLRLLEARRHAGDLDDAGFERALAELDHRYDAMLDRLDGSFRIPSPRS